MGYAEGKSMLYLEARSLLATRAAGSQGSQNGSISCIALRSRCPTAARGDRENLIAMLLGMEVASATTAGVALGNPQGGQADAAVHSGTDFITSGYGAIRAPTTCSAAELRRERAGRLVRPAARHADRRRITPVTEERVLDARARAARALQAVFRALASAITDDEIAAATGPTARRTCRRDRVADIEAAQRLQHGPLTVLD